jgi:ABC-type multidrug transport system fused ATPase/permease subunit
MADEILVLQSGRIRERGTHPDLLQAEGLYWKLWQVQNSVLAVQP